MPWEETENEIRHRLRDPSDFEEKSFRRITIKQDRPQVFAIVGKLKNGDSKMVAQALRFPKDQGWTIEKAKAWFKEHWKSAADIAVRLDDPGGSVIRMPRQALAAELAPVPSDTGERIAELNWYTGATVPRLGWGGLWYLTFSMKPEHVRMGRLQSGKAPLLNSHQSYELSNVIGIIQSADLNGKARVRFSNRAEVTPIWNDVEDGIIRNASMGTIVYKLQDLTAKDEEGNPKGPRTYMAVDWEPLEVSLVPVGADPAAGLRLSEIPESELTEVEIVAGARDSVLEIERERLRLLSL